MNNLERVLVVIPSFCPPPSLPENCQRLLNLGFRHILIVDDGSPCESGAIFKTCKDFGVSIIHLGKNFGKGEALRRGMKYLLHSTIWDSAVFCDDDGQHSSQDVLSVTCEGLRRNCAFLIGTRDLTRMPLKSWIGNLAMKKLLSFHYGLNIPDTQSGLRYIRKDILSDLVSIRSDRFSFEIVCLIHLVKRGSPIQTIPIETIYHAQNKHTRFKAIEDSLDVLKSFFQPGKE
jgi:glycosyltransferase involved in cell wall biosynthesis